MFYVSGISGTLVPFDPNLTPISSAVSPVSAVGEVVSVRATSTRLPGEGDNLILTSQVAKGQTSENVVAGTEEAAVYDGHSPNSEKDLAGPSNAGNIGRAASVMAYRIQDSEFESENEIDDSVSAIRAVTESDGVHNDGKEHPDRVNPVKKSANHYPAPNRERKRVLIAADIMNSPVFSLREDVSVEVAQKIFKQHKFRHIPITSVLGKLVGIISDRDCMGVDAQNASVATLLKNYMVTNILTTGPQTAIPLIAGVMISHHIGCIPILDPEGVMVGIITRSDILRAIVNHAPIELWS